ncbi:PilZ domain-containing protein [Ammoniphilus resinae]|uniref:PilZ domain-containing protein n=1 Tax=Ammoniphilus resinae TaxID=861532 RepID=A0ABS4GIX5_9BACL|nr:PilZ domain-containing protein [Ammoniphilus resinae]MBP1930213.1 hypothetical protein [Ammoniphilus resinae]
MSNQEAQFPIFRRQDGFRLVFQKSISASFKILHLQGREVESKEGTIEILDMSLTGAKVTTSLQIPVNKTIIQLECTIHHQKLRIAGELKWVRESYKGYIYGMAFDPKSYSERTLHTELKNYVKQYT